MMKRIQLDARQSAKVWAAITVGATLMVGCQATPTAGATSSALVCEPGAVSPCTCPGRTPATTTCRFDGKGWFSCNCDLPIATAGSPAATSTPSAANSGTAGAPGAAAGTTIAGSATNAEMDTWRKACVDEINAYRAKLPALALIKRGNANQEACSDQGAQSDSVAMTAHGFARMDAPGLAKTCRNTPTPGLLTGNNTCQGMRVGAAGPGSYATVVDALKGCLKNMWAQGEPPGGRAVCTGPCSDNYGHYLNLTDPASASVSCSFFKLRDGQSWWMNQDFSAF
jgi:hypothetical protein